MRWHDRNGFFHIHRTSYRQHSQRVGAASEESKAGQASGLFGWHFEPEDQLAMHPSFPFDPTLPITALQRLTASVNADAAARPGGEHPVFTYTERCVTVDNSNPFVGCVTASRATDLDTGMLFIIL